MALFSTCVLNMLTNQRFIPLIYCLFLIFEQHFWLVLSINKSVQENYTFLVGHVVNEKKCSQYLDEVERLAFNVLLENLQIHIS